MTQFFIPLCFEKVYAKFRMPSKLRPSHGNLQGTSETGGQRGGPSPPVFERSDDLKSTKGEDYALHIITRSPQIFRPSDTPVCSLLGTDLSPVNSNLHVGQNGLFAPALKKPSWDCKNFCTGEFLAKNHCRNCHQNPQRIFHVL